MACPVCEHTMHNVGVMPEPYTKVPLFWCARCGTLKANVVSQQDESPMLVKHARTLADEAEYAILGARDEEDPKTRGAIATVREAIGLEAVLRGRD